MEKGDDPEVKRFMKLQDEFLRKHLSTWIPVFTKVILSSTKEDFFKGLAILTMGLVKEDTEFIKSISEEELS